MSLSQMLYRVFLTLLVVATFLPTTASNEDRRPNILFLVCESTDGRTWQQGYQNSVIPLPNLHFLAENGHAFHRHYSNSPVCCPSRATLWSGRHAHKIPHMQVQQRRNATSNTTITRKLPVRGVWNNFEGLPHNFSDRIDQILETKANYTIHLSGKLDYTTGSHSDNVKMSAWTMYTPFPYDIPQWGGWADELPYICGDNGTVLEGNQSAHGDDWHTLRQTIQWMKDYHSNNTTNTSSDKKPWFVYQGMNIVHPPYGTNEYYYNQIDPTKIRVPEWPPLEDLHPCDLQSSMLKGCIPPLLNATARQVYYQKERRRNIRRIYYAMIAEFDAMVGAYIETLRDLGQLDNTVIIVTSDHGDLQMEHQQSYKMVPYDASSSVPLIIYDGRQHAKHTNTKKNGANSHRSSNHYDSLQQPVVHLGRVIDTPTQLIDLYPTIMDLAQVDTHSYPTTQLDGHSLVPLMKHDLNGGAKQMTQRPDFVVSQFHGMNIAMSWFLIVKSMPCIVTKTSKNTTPTTSTANSSMCSMKLVVWGTGNEVDHQLFDLTHDPDEMINHIHDPIYAFLVPQLEASLRSVVDYPSVAMDVATYNRDSFRNWIEVMGDPAWRHAIHEHHLRWDHTWNINSEGAFAALEQWLAEPEVKVRPCRSRLVWPSLLSDTMVVSAKS